MHFTAFINSLKSGSGALLAAYFGVVVFLQIRDRHQPLTVAREIRHAIWAAAMVTTVHSLWRETAFPTGHVFGEAVHIAITVFVGVLLYMLGTMFEVPEIKRTSDPLLQEEKEA